MTTLRNKQNKETSHIASQRYTDSDGHIIGNEYSLEKEKK
jgi:hypothetical protein